MQSATALLLKLSGKRDLRPNTVANIESVGRRRGIKCQYEEEGLPFFASKFTLADSSSSLARKDLESLLAQQKVQYLDERLPTQISSPLIPGLRTRDVELLHHYFTLTAFTIASDPFKQYIWRYRVPDMAKHSGYLMHNILALSAVNNAHIRPYHQQRYRSLAAYHQCKAANGFRLAVQELSPENAGAVCASAGINILSELGFSLCPDERDSQVLDPIQDLLTKFALVRRTITLWRCSLPLLENKYSSSVILKQDEHLTLNTTLAEVPIALQTLQSLVEDLPMETDERNICKRAVLLLILEFRTILTQPRDFGQILRWSILVDSPFLELVRMRRPLALVVLAHYCVIFHHATTRWCLKGWAEKVFYAIKASLDQSWAQHLDWGTEAIEVEPQLRFPDDTLFTPNTDNTKNFKLRHDELQFWMDDQTAKATAAAKGGVWSMGPFPQFPYRPTLLDLTTSSVPESRADLNAVDTMLNKAQMSGIKALWF